MSLLSDEEIDALWLPDGITKPQMIVRRAVVRAAEKALLAKLASAELPEPVVIDRHESGIVIRGYTAAQLQQAHAQGFAAGAAAQLAEKPSGYLSQYNLEMLQQGYPQTIVMLEGAKRDVPLYTRRDTK